MENPPNKPTQSQNPSNVNLPQNINLSKLNPYQLEGVKFLRSKRFAILADEMGLGKSAQAIVASQGAKSILVLCPAIGVFNWKDEFEKWLDPALPKPKIHIVSYNKFTTAPGSIPFTPDLLICDEAHYLKNYSSKRTKAVFGKDGIANRVKATWLLTGTPMPNYPNDLWVFLRKSGQTDLDYRSFCLRYCATIPSGFGMGFRIVGMKMDKSDELKDQLSKIMLMRKKEDVLKELPALHWVTVMVEPGPVDLEIEKSFVYLSNPTPPVDLIRSELCEQVTLVEKLVSVCGKDQYQLIAPTLSAIAPAMSTMRKINGLKKVKGVIELVTDELENSAYDKIVIFAYHLSVIQQIHEGLSKFGAVKLTGHSKEWHRKNAVEEFQTKKDCRVFVGQLHACGTTINLTAARHVLIVEPDWVPANNAQAIARCHRIGQERMVLARYVGIADSIDSQVTKILAKKTQAELSLFSKSPLTSEGAVVNAVYEDRDFGRILDKLDAIKNEARELREKQKQRKHFDEDRYHDPKYTISGPFGLGDPNPKSGYLRSLIENATGDFANEAVTRTLFRKSNYGKRQKPDE